MNESKTYVIGPAQAPKQTLEVLNGGSNRGARENMRAFSDFNARSTRLAIVPVYTDPLPGRAQAMKEEAERQGIAARAIEGRIEDLAIADTGSTSPVILNLDRASAIAGVLKKTGATRRAMLGYLLVKLPTGRLLGVRFVLEPGDQARREQAIGFFDRLAEVSERNGSGAILGVGADAAHVLAEPKIREWFAEHCERNLAKIAAGVEPSTDPFEVTVTGQETIALHIALRQTWADPAALADDILADPSSPIRRGSQFMIAEVTPAGLRFHAIRRRTDDRMTVSGAETIDRATVDAEQHRAMAAAEAARLARLVRETISRQNPLTTTD